jgi:N-acetylglucosaminyldiphosphoundecaprenol N-acetyl-beta-D-mannosaminyltransferase
MSDEFVGSVGAKEDMQWAATAPSVTLYGVHVAALGFDDAVRWVLARARRSIPTSVVAINAGKVREMERSPLLRKALADADLVIADGVPIVWASHLFGRSLPSRVNGTDLMEATFAAAEKHGVPIYLLGARADVLEKAVSVIAGRHPSLEIAGQRDGYFTDEEEHGVAVAIAESGARLLYLAISSPKKELFLHRNREALGDVVAIGVGGSLDVIAGVTKRAPRFMQRSGLEWFYRLLQEPRRMWRRYLIGNAAFVWITLRDLVRELRAKTPTR